MCHDPMPLSMHVYGVIDVDTGQDGEDIGLDETDEDFNSGKNDGSN